MHRFRYLFPPGPAQIELHAPIVLNILPRIAYATPFSSSTASFDSFRRKYIYVYHKIRFSFRAAVAGQHRPLRAVPDVPVHGLLLVLRPRGDRVPPFDVADRGRRVRRLLRHRARRLLPLLRVARRDTAPAEGDHGHLSEGSLPKAHHRKRCR